jgi:hypothetical protein
LVNETEEKVKKDLTSKEGLIEMAQALKSLLVEIGRGSTTQRAVLYQTVCEVLEKAGEPDGMVFLPDIAVVMEWLQKKNPRLIIKATLDHGDAPGDFKLKVEDDYQNTLKGAITDFYVALRKGEFK